MMNRERFERMTCQNLNSEIGGHIQFIILHNFIYLFYFLLPPSSWIFIHVLWELQTISYLSFLLKRVSPVRILEQLIQSSTAYSVAFFLSRFFLSSFHSCFFVQKRCFSFLMCTVSVRVGDVIILFSQLLSFPSHGSHSFIRPFLTVVFSILYYSMVFLVLNEGVPSTPHS
jgi:hypothetical protein